VARAAAENLVPCTLELGGKSPVLVHDAFPIEAAAERVAVGKLFNAGQTCIAPDYALVPRAKVRAFTEAFLAATQRLYPSHAGLTAIISDRAKSRLEGLVADARAKGATAAVAPGLASGRVMSPVVLSEVNDDMLVMQDEIFGPVLPVEAYDTLDEALARIARRPRPLAAYLFDPDAARAHTTLDRVVCGGACINDTLVHFAQEQLPFGGVGPSGMGAYHGQTGFETFSHQRAVLTAGRVSAAKAFMTPPYGPLVDKALELLVRGLRPGR
jgi:coniferyl-aldehyde dehydrogenase